MTLKMGVSMLLQDPQDVQHRCFKWIYFRINQTVYGVLYKRWMVERTRAAYDVCNFFSLGRFEDVHFVN